MLLHLSFYSISLSMSNYPTSKNTHYYLSAFSMHMTHIGFLHLCTFKTPIIDAKKITKGNCGFHATICLSSNKGVSQSFIFFGLKHSGLLFPVCCNCSNSRMFFDALISLSIQHNLHSLSLQRITLLI